MDSMGIQTAHCFIATDGNMLFNVRSESLSVDFFSKILKSFLIIKVFYALAYGTFLKYVLFSSVSTIVRTINKIFRTCKGALCLTEI